MAQLYGGNLVAPQSLYGGSLSAPAQLYGGSLVGSAQLYGGCITQAEFAFEIYDGEVDGDNEQTDP